MKGKITNYNLQKGYGFIRGEDGLVRFFHTSDVKGFAIPVRGDVAEFRPEQTKRGLIATSVRIKKINCQPEYIEFGSIKIKLRDINSYSLDKFEPAPLVTYQGMSKRIEKFYKKSSELAGDCLYVTTYKNDKYTFYNANCEFNIYDKYRELDDWLNM